MKTNVTKKSVAFELDELDLMLIKELEWDARQTNVLLAEKLNTSQMTVKRRLQRLLDEGVITLATIVAMPTHLIGVNIGLNVEPGKATHVAEFLRKFRHIQRIILTTGRYDIILSMAFSNFNLLIDFLDTDLSRIPHLLSAEKIVVMETAKRSWKYLSDDLDSFRRPSPCEFDELDLQLIKELEQNPRESIKELADKLDVNRKLIGKKMQSLLAGNIIQVVSIATPSFFGYNVPVFIFIKVRPGKIRFVANSLISEKRIHHIVIVSGPFDLFVNATFRDLDEMSGFLINRLGGYNGVVSHEILIQVGFVKRSYSVLT